jgi:serine/threonine protein kinase
VPAACHDPPLTLDRTHKAQIDQDSISGRKIINHYELIDEIGRGVHGKVKLARNLNTGDYVAVKIIQRYAKKKRLGRANPSPEKKIQREIAILKKIRHPNVVGLIEVIDDPEKKKIYMILEYVELGEIVWRKKGTPQICLYERRRIEREMRGDKDAGQDEKFFQMIERRRLRKEQARAKHSMNPSDAAYWSLEHGDDEEDDVDDSESLSRKSSTQDSLPQYLGSYTSLRRSDIGSMRRSRATSRATSRAPSASSQGHTPLPVDFGIGPEDSDKEDEMPNALFSSLSSLHLHSGHSSGHALDTFMYPHFEDPSFRRRSPSMADSIISHMSSVDDIVQHDSFEEDFSYVPCFTMDQARSTFRDTVLGLEYLHYEGIVHRDIKPANLLWTKDHRVKISDFGVSYFGRPSRSGQTEGGVSESDANDEFDDDIELAKTVGTPAFFAPELCYTDLDVEQPKITEQIDVWSLGVTLYCLIFARIPFLAEDEYQLFRAIAQQDVYIPKRRLKAVDPSHPTSRTNLRHMGPSTGPYREEGELLMEDIDDELYDLLRRMLIKDPTERMKLREVKRHPWVVKGLDNLIGWLDDTDPSRKAKGRKIQVDDRELEHAVIPFSIFERARSTMRKVVTKITGRGESNSSGGRRRAISNATSSGGEISQHSSPSTPLWEVRRQSLRGDETYFAVAKEPRGLGEHPLSQSVTASPEPSSSGYEFFPQDSTTPSSAIIEHPLRDFKKEEENLKRPSLTDRKVSLAASIQTLMPSGHSISNSVPDSPRSSSNRSEGANSPAVEPTFTDHMGNVIRDTRKTKHSIVKDDLLCETKEATTRTQSADRSLFNSSNKHSGASIAISHAIAPGNMEQPSPKRHTYAFSESIPRSLEHSPLSPTTHLRRPSLVASQQSMSTPNVIDRIFAASLLDDRPSTATRIEVRTPAPRIWRASTPETFARAQKQLLRRRRQESEVEQDQQRIFEAHKEATRSQPSSCPPSPDDETFRQKREDDMRAQSTSSMNSYNLLSPITSPSEFNSPLSSVNLSASRLGSSQDRIFPSDHSLPTLASGASSVSGDTEGDFLTFPGTVETNDSMTGSGGTPDTMTPASLSKEQAHEDGVTSPRMPIVADEDEDGYNGDGDHTLASQNDDDSDSDEGLTMGSTRRKPGTALPPRKKVQRRDTNISICSTETAKKVPMTD